MGARWSSQGWVSCLASELHPLSLDTEMRPQGVPRGESGQHLRFTQEPRGLWDCPYTPLLGIRRPGRDSSGGRARGGRDCRPWAIPEWQTPGPASEGRNLIEACPLHWGLGSPRNLSVSPAGRRGEYLEVTGGIRQAQRV